MNASTRLRNIELSHAIALSRYSTGLARDITALLNSVDDDLVDILAKRLVNIERGPVTTKRLEVMLEELRAVNSTVYEKVAKRLDTEFLDFAEFEVTHQVAALQSVLPTILTAQVPPTVMLASIVRERPFQGVLLKSWVEGMETGRMNRLEQSLRIGLVEGQTTDQIVSRIRGTRALKYQDGILEISRRSAQAMVRTGITHVATQAREETYSANQDIIKGVQWVATLDGRTTLVCASRDGVIYDVSAGPRPPAHVSCRSTSIPILRSWRDIGIASDSSDPSMRASLDGAIPAKTTYQEFLVGKSAAFQDDVLGSKAKGDAFRNGLQLDRFVDGSGASYNLADLKRLNPGFFS